MMDERYFEFTLGRNTEPIQYRVRVYWPARGLPIPGLGPQQSPNTNIFNNLLNMLTPDHIAREPNPTITLVNDRAQRSYRIDSQPATVKYRNIHYQEEDRSYAVSTVDHGGELCYAAGYQVNLLRYIKAGLYLSYSSRCVHNIRVTVEKRDRGEKKPTDITNRFDPQTIVSTFKKYVKIRKNAKEIVTEFEKNTSKIIRGTDMIEHVNAAIERQFAKIAEKEGAHTLEKKIPFVSTILGVVFAVQRGWHGDYAGAIAEVVSGVAADVPGLGTALSLTIDAGMLARDIKEAVDDERKHKKLLESEVDVLKKRNEQIRNEAAEILQESPMYGAGCTKPFDEFGLATLEDIIEIKVRCGDLIDAIQMVYRSQSGQQHGGNGGSLRVLRLRTEEKITAVRGTTLDGGRVISSLTFCTDYGREETFGVKKGDQFEFEMTDGSYLGAIKGFDAYDGGSKTYPRWRGCFQLLPAIGFIPKF